MNVKPVDVWFSDEMQVTALAQIKELMSTGMLSSGGNVAAFETEVAEYLHVDHAIALSSGTTALEVAIQAVSGLEKGSVLMASNAHFADWSAVVRTGHTPALVDIGSQSVQPGLSELAAAREGDTVGVILVHIGGHIQPDMQAVADWCSGEGLWLIEDCAHAHGSQRDGRYAGSFGDAGIFSFFATKVVPMGEGGMVVTRRRDVADMARRISNLGKDQQFGNEYLTLGQNGRMPELSAVIGRVQFGRLDEEIAVRESLSKMYDELLSELPGLTALDRGHRTSGYKYISYLDPRYKRDDLRRSLAARGVQLGGEVYDKPLYRQPPVVKSVRDLEHPYTEAFCATHVCLPLHGRLVERDVKHVIDSCEAALREQRAHLSDH